MRKLGLALAASLGVMGPQVGAQNYSGNDLHAACQSPETLVCAAILIGFNHGRTVGVMIGSMEYGASPEQADELAYGGVGFCLPEGVTRAQVQDIVANYLTDHPETRHRTAGLLIETALQEAFPCPAP